MNRFNLIVLVASALVVGLVAGVASANKGGHRHHGHLSEQQEQEEFEPHHLSGHHGHFGGGLGHISDELLIEELKHRGIGHHSGFGGYPHQHSGEHFHPGNFRHQQQHGKQHGIKSRRGQKLGGGGAGIGAGAIGGLEASKNKLHAQGSHTHLDGHGSAEVHEGSFMGAGIKGEAGKHKSSHNDQEGIHKHQVINNDKTIIKDHTTGVNDVDGFRNSNGNSESGHVSGATGILGGQSAGGRLEGHKNFDHEQGSLGASSSDFGAGAAGGIGAGALGGEI